MVNRQQYIHPLVDGAGVSHHCCVVVVSDVFGGGQSLVRSDVHYGWGDAATGHDVGIVWAASRLVFMRKIMRQSLLSLFWEIVDGEWVRRTLLGSVGVPISLRQGVYLKDPASTAIVSLEESPLPEHVRQSS